MPNDQYKIGELLGRGGMGQVHVARHRSGRVVAVKRVRNTLMSDRALVARLIDEAQLLRTVSHPNVVRALDHGTDEHGMPFLIMDRAHGTPLHQVIAHDGALAIERVRTIASQLFAGLTAIHDAQIVHADLKSHNVLVDEVNIVTIIDFGLARTLSLTADTSNLVAGTPAYMAPEVIAGGEPSVAGDVYGAAVIIYEMLTATTPFSGHISTILTRQLTEEVEPPSRRAPQRNIAPALDRVLLRALAPSPAARYATVPAFAAAFGAALAIRPATTPPPVFTGGRDTVEDVVREPREAMPGDAAGVVDQPTLRRAVAPIAPRPVARPSERTMSIISAALVHAQRLLEDRCVAEAARSLEAALAELSPKSEARAADRAEVWRIETVLAALYDTLGKQERARRMALVAHRHAVETGCPQAEQRASALVNRLATRTRRLARGSLNNQRR